MVLPLKHPQKKKHFTKQLQIEKMKKLILSAAITWLAQIAYCQNYCTVEINGLKSNKGKCLVYVYKTKNGFPTYTKYASSVVTATIQNGSCSAVLKDMLTGEHAILVVHDANDNGKMDTNFLGMPKEGIGTSNNAKSSFGPPSFDDSKFKIDGKPMLLKITLKYL
jgi:uncharacterized protein (DUF2141 family)